MPDELLSPLGADRQQWQVHRGGFQHLWNCLVAPDALPAHLTPVNWQGEATWLSGDAMRVLFLTPSNRSAPVFATPGNRVIASPVVLWGMTVRHGFNT
jgi:uncharacterized membrane protein